MSDTILIQVLSDMHTERSGYLYLDSDYYKTDADVVVVPGDIAKAPDVVGVLKQLFPGKLVVFTSGNHEHYKTRMTIDEAHTLIRSHVSALNSQGTTRAVFLDDTVEYVDVKGHQVKFIGGTLWTDFDLFGKKLMHMKEVPYALNDYQFIKGEDNKLLTAKETLRRHTNTRRLLEHELEKDFDGPVIVLTHHLPTIDAVATRYKNDTVSAGFASNMDDMIGKSTLWCSGHTHTSSIFRKGDSLFVCNPEGCRCIGEPRENPDFIAGMVVEIKRDSTGLYRGDRQ